MMRQPGNRRILLVDDEPAIRFTLATLLSNKGYEVVTAATYEQALTCLAQHDIDLLLTDLLLAEGESGLAIAQHTRVHYPHVTILILTGWMDFNTLVPQHSTDVFNCLIKTTGPQELLNHVAELLAMSHLETVE